MTRTTTRIVLGVSLAVLVGCGSKKDDPPAAKIAPDDPKPAPGTDTPPVTTATAVPPIIAPPPPKPAAWEMDATKHEFPLTAATGKLAGGAFAPTAQFMGDTLAFHVLKDLNPEREIKITFSPEHLKSLQGLKLTVKPDQPAGPTVPVIDTEIPNPKPDVRDPLRFNYPSGYALTLEVGKKADGKLPGKVFLSLPGDDKTFLAGTFAAEWVRLPSLPPEQDEGPFVHGSVGVANSPGSFVRIGYLGVDAADKAHGDALGLEMESPRYTTADQSKPTASMLVSNGLNKPGRYDHTRLVPGRYLVYAAAGMTTGPAVWKWLTVTPDTKAVVNFELDGRKAGKVELTLPAGAKGKAWLMPPPDPAVPFPADLTQAVAASLGLLVEFDKGKAAFPQVSPGTYQVFAGDLTGSVTVEAGKTATVELKPMKK